MANTSRIRRTRSSAPRFRTGVFDGGVARGVDDVITVLTTDAAEWQQRPSLRIDNQPPPGWLDWLMIAGAIALLTLLIVSPRFRGFFLNVALNILVNSGNPRGGAFPRGGEFPGGGGFRGGGGSSGCGGASGRW